MRAVHASKMHKKYDPEPLPIVTPGDLNDALPEVGIVVSLATTKGDRKEQDEKDTERWAKLKRLKQVFHVKRAKAKDAAMK